MYLVNPLSSLTKNLVRKRQPPPEIAIPFQRSQYREIIDDAIHDSLNDHTLPLSWI